MDPPLFCTWTLYVHYEVECGQVYTSKYKKLRKFDTIMGFWYTFKALPDPDVLCEGRAIHNGSQIVGYSIFRDDITPEWEHPMNSPGYDICTRFDDLKYVTNTWRDICLAAIGNRLDCLGMRLVCKPNPRRLHVKQEVWFDQHSDPDDMFKLILQETPGHLRWNLNYHAVFHH